MDNRIQLIIADDHEVLRDGLKNLLAKSNDLEVIGEAGTGKQLIALCRKKLPDVVITDIMMPVMDGVEATAYITKHFPTVRVIAFSMYIEENLIIDMLHAGASGYLLKNANKSEIIEAIHSVYKNKPFYCTGTTVKLARLIGDSQYGPHTKSKITFTEREVEITRMICEEKTNKEIGDELNMSSRTVEEYRQKLREKMDAKGTAGIIIYAIKHGLYRVQKNI